MRLLKLFVFVLFIAKSSTAQSLLIDSVMNVFMLNVNYSFQVPFGEIKDRFGNNSALGAGIGLKISKNILLKAEGNFLFGRNVKEDDILSGITDQKGFLIGTSGLYTDYTFSEKGFSIQAQGGKILSFKKPNVNSGLTMLVGLGFLQHKISIDADDKEAPMLSKEYKKGYDRLTNGILLSQFLGYFFLDAKRKRLNFYGGLEIKEAFTKNRRSWNYDENRKDDSSRLDIFLGIKIGWTLPFYFVQTEKYYYN